MADADFPSHDPAADASSRADGSDEGLLGSSDPPGFDLAFARAAISWRGWLAATSTIALFSPLVWKLAPGPALRIETSAPFWVLGAWPLTYAAAVLAGERFFRDSRYGWLRWLCMSHAVAAFVALAACSSHPISPLWSLMLLLPPCWGQAFPKNRAALVSVLIVPAALRWWTVPSVTWSSLVGAGVVSAAAAAMYWWLSTRRLSFRALELRLRMAEALGAPGLDQAAALAQAMRVHDGLSGSLMLARARARRGEGETVLDAARRFAEQARAALPAADDAGDPSDDLETTLMRTAQLLGLQLHVRVAGRLPDELRADIAEIVTELLANQARHGARGSVRVSVSSDSTDVRVVVEAPGEIVERTSSAGGRGLKNLQLRVGALAGRVLLSSEQGVVRMEMLLPSRDEDVPATYWLVETGFHLVVPLVVWLFTRDGLVTAFMAVTVGMLTALQLTNVKVAFATTQRLRMWLRFERQRRSGPVRRLVSAALGPGLAALDHALARGSVGEVRAALGDLSERLEDLLWSLEVGLDRSRIDLALGDLARELGVGTAPSSFDVAPAALFDVRRQIRGLAARAPESVSAAARV